MRWNRRVAILWSAAWILACGSGLLQADDRDVKIGKFTMTAPEGWESKEPRVRIIAYEFASPPAKGDSVGGRLTIMQAGGSVDANVDRWYGQFTQPDGGSTKERSKVEKKTIAGQTVHVVDIKGTFKDQAGPFAPAVEREKYRMLGAIVETDNGSFFLKFYGPEKTMAEQEGAFLKMVDSLK